jgi:hypothetical protein
MEVAELVRPGARRTFRAVTSAVQHVPAGMAMIQTLVSQEPLQQMAAAMPDKHIVMGGRAPVPRRAHKCDATVLQHEGEPDAGLLRVALDKGPFGLRAHKRSNRPG